MKRKTKPKADAAKADSPASDTSASDEFDVDEVNRKIKERIERMSSPVGFASAASLTRARKSVGDQFKAAMVESDFSEEQSKTSDQIDSEEFESMWDEYAARMAYLRDSPAETITPEKLKIRLDALAILGRGLLMALVIKRCRKNEDEKLPKKIVEGFGKIDVRKEYQFWYTESLAVIKRVLPSRLKDFIRLYECPRKRSKLTSLNFRIVDAICGRYFPEEWRFGLRRSDVITTCKVLDLSDCLCLIEAQCDILEAARKSITTSLHKIQQVAQAELLASELSVARRLNKNGSPCAAGVIAGVVLEKHLKAVIESRGFVMPKKSHGINYYARKLNGIGVIDDQTCQFVQSLGKLHDRCYNAKSEPAKEEVYELISGVEQIIKAVF